jgi:hypothetical protein
MVIQSMRCRATYSIAHEAFTAAQARSIAFVHFEQLRDQLLVEGADHPCEFTLSHVYVNEHEILDEALTKPM